jgi:hypothetical protein
LSSITPMSLISQKDRELTIVAVQHYVDFLKSEIEFFESENLLDDPEYLDYTSELPEVYALLNWIRLEHFKHEN